MILAAWTDKPNGTTVAPTALNTGQAVKLQLLARGGELAPAMLGRLGSAAVAAGFDWVSYKNRSYIYASVRPSDCQTDIDLLFIVDGSGSMYAATCRAPA